MALSPSGTASSRCWCQVRIPDDVVDFILMTTSREVGDLITAFEAVFRLSMELKRRITLPLAREARERQLSGGCP